MSDLKEIEEYWGKVCFDPSFQPEGQYQTYRELVFQGMMDVLQSICPVARGILSEEEWGNVFWEFLRESPPDSVVLRKLPFEVSQYLKSHPHSLQEKYPYLGELMEYEYLEVQVRFAEEDEGTTPSGKLRLNPAHALGHYTWPVHFISEEHRDPATLPQGEYFLFLWRDSEDLKVRFMEINPLMAKLFESLLSGPKDSRTLLTGVAEQMDITPTEEYLAEGGAMVDNLVAKGIFFQA